MFWTILISNSHLHIASIKLFRNCGIMCGSACLIHFNDWQQQSRSNDGFNNSGVLWSLGYLIMTKICRDSAGLKHTKSESTIPRWCLTDIRPQPLRNPSLELILGFAIRECAGMLARLNKRTHIIWPFLLLLLSARWSDRPPSVYSLNSTSAGLGYHGSICIFF